MSEQHDIKNGTGWVAIPCSLMFDETLTKFEKLVWLNFAAHINRKSGACFPSAETQAREIQCSIDMVKKSRGSLIERGWLVKEHIKNASGQFTRWQWTIIQAENQRMEKPPVGEPNGRENQRVGFSTTNQKKLNQKKVKPEEVKPFAKSSTEDIAEKRYPINQVMEAFQMKLNPTIQYGNKTQRKAVEDLIRAVGLEKVIGAINYCATLSGDQFAPTITTPIQLREKFAALVSYHKKQSNKPALVASI